LTPVTTHYDVLGVDDTAEVAQIKRAYYDRARLYHPDAHIDSPPSIRAEAERAMQALNAAWTVLRQPATRRRYDRQLSLVRAEVEGAGAAGESARPGAGVGSRRRTRRPAGAARAALGSGFRYWLGTAGGVLRDEHGRPQFNLEVTGDTLEPLRALAPDGLAALHCQRSAIDDRELEHLQGMRSLRLLDLSGTAVGDAGLVHLLGCTSLESLDLWDTGVTDDGLAVLGRLPNLRNLGLGGTAVSDEGLRHLAGLSHLRLLQLWGTEVNGPGLVHLANLGELESVTVPRRVRWRYRRYVRGALVPL